VIGDDPTAIKSRWSTSLGNECGRKLSEQLLPTPAGESYDIHGGPLDNSCAVMTSADKKMPLLNRARRLSIECDR